MGEPGLEQRLADFRILGEKNGSFLLASESWPCPVHVAYLPEHAFDRILASLPYTLYPWIEGRVVHDPDAILAPYIRKVTHYFTVRPRLVDMWRQQLGKVAAHKVSAANELAHPVWSHLNKHIAATLDAEYLKYTEAEQSHAEPHN